MPCRLLIVRPRLVKISREMYSTISRILYWISIPSLVCWHLKKTLHNKTSTLNMGLYRISPENALFVFAICISVLKNTPSWIHCCCAPKTYSRNARTETPHALIKISPSPLWQTRILHDAIGGNIRNVNTRTRNKSDSDLRESVSPLYARIWIFTRKRVKRKKIIIIK